MRQPRRRPHPIVGVLRAAPVVVALFLTAGHAQPVSPSVTEVLPATAVVVLYAGPTGVGFGVIQEILDTLDLDAAKATLAALGGEAMDGDAARDDLDIAGIVADLLDQVALECPELAETTALDELDGLTGPAVLAISVSPFNPLPGGIAVARPDDTERAAELQDALIACYGDGPVLREGDVALHVVGDGGDLPLVLARVDGLFLAATDPELVRAAVRIAQGSDEPRHVDGAIGREAAALMDGGLGITLDLAALADAAEGLRGMVPAGDDVAPAIDRLLATLRTIGGVAARITLDEAGLRIDSIVTADATGGDAALVRLLACEACRPGTPRLIPSGVASLQARVLAPADLVDWIDGWLGEASALVGQPLDLRSLALESFGVDLDVALLDWVGATWHTAQVDVLGTDLRGWLSGPGMITTVPVTSEEAARRGLELWQDVVRDLPALAQAFGADIPGDAAPFGERVGEEDRGMLSVRSAEYRGVGYERWRFGPTVDVALLVLDGHLVIASPAASVRRVIDVQQGAPGVEEDAVMRSALASLPSAATAYSVFDVSRMLRGLATITDLAGAPVATALALGIAGADEQDEFDDFFMDDFSWGGFTSGAVTGLRRSADYFGPDPRPDGATFSGVLEVPGSVTATITPDDTVTNGYGLVYELAGLQPGDLVEIEMLDLSDGAIDTYLYLFDLAAGVVVADNDDAPGYDRSEIVFEVVPGIPYAVVATSYGGADFGDIALNTTVLEPAGTPVATTPERELEDEPDDGEPALAARVSFDQVVGLFDLLTDFLDRLAERSGVAVGSTETVDGVTRSTLRIPLR
jgi:hypothetical protein